MVAMAAHKPKVRHFTARLARFRLGIQLAFLFAWLDPLLLRMHTVCGPVFHCYSCPLATFACPIGVLANFSALHVFPFFAVGLLLATGALLGTFVCGWICPFGLFQDLIGRIPTKKFVLPGWTGYFRFVVLIVLVLAVPYLWGKDSDWFFCSLCPAGALEGAVPHMVDQARSGATIVWPSIAKLSIVGVLLAAMLFTWRPWCTVFCPLGAIYSLCNSFSFFFIGVKKDACNDCGLCRSMCRYGDGPTQRANDLRCIKCLDCTKCNKVKLAGVFTPHEGAKPSEKPETIA